MLRAGAMTDLHQAIVARMACARIAAALALHHAAHEFDRNAVRRRVTRDSRRRVRHRPCGRGA